MKRKILALLLFAALVILASCGAEDLAHKEVKPAPSSPQITDIEQEKDEPFRFAVMADSRGSDGGINTKIVEKTLESIIRVSPQPLFAVMPGDLIEGAKSYSDVRVQLLHFKNTITRYYPMSFFYPGFGNHEASAGIPGEQAFKEIFSEMKANFLEGYNNTVYYFDKNNTRLYMLNSNHPGEVDIISDKQLNFIKSTAGLSKKHNIYFFHQPAYPTGSHLGDSLDVNKLQRNKLWETIDRSQSPLVFCGHEHNYTRRHINSDFNEIVNGHAFEFNKKVYQVTAGSFGAPLSRNYTDKKNVDVPPAAEYHYAIVDVNINKIQVTVYNLDGKVIDQFEQ